MPKAKTQQYGGSFAPPLTATEIKKYEKLAKDADPQVSDYMTTLLNMVKKFSETGESKNKPKKHPSGVGTITQLEDAEVKRMWDHVPWEHDLKAMGEVFEQIDNETDKDLRDAAHHLLWFGYELTNDREPLTNDKL
jgi:hypothetical protein